MQVLGAHPTDAELAVLLAPEGRSWHLRTEETPERLVARPSRLTLWWGVFWLLIPLAVIVGYLGRKAVLEGLDSWDVMLILHLSFGAPVCFWFVWWLSQAEVSKGDFFVLDKARRALILPRQRLQFGGQEILGFVEVYAWHTTSDREGYSSDWVGELTVLVRGGPGEIVRYPMVTCLYTRGVTRVGESLAEFFSVERRVLKLDRKMRRRLQAEGGPAA